MFSRDFFSMFSRVHFVLDKVARNASHSILKSRIVSKNASLKQSKDFLGQRKLLYLECQFIAKFLSKTPFSGKLPFDCIFVAKSGNLNFLQTPLFFSLQKFESIFGHRSFACTVFKISLKKTKSLILQQTI